MPWTYEEIEREWLGGSRIAVPADEVVAAFERCERDLGREPLGPDRLRLVI